MTPLKSFALYLFITTYCKTALATDVEIASEMLVCVLAISDSVATPRRMAFDILYSDFTVKGTSNEKVLCLTEPPQKYELNFA